jgi:hypothetical protein
LVVAVTCPPENPSTAPWIDSIRLDIYYNSSKTMIDTETFRVAALNAFVGYKHVRSNQSQALDPQFAASGGWCAFEQQGGVYRLRAFRYSGERRPRGLGQVVVGGFD